MTENKIPIVGSQWQWRESDRIYTVIAIANRDSTNLVYPVTVLYLGRNGKLWAKPIDTFLKTMNEETL